MRYFRGTRLDQFKGNYDPETGLLSIPDDRKFYFYKAFSLGEMIVHLGSKNGAGGYAVRNAGKHDDYPAILSGKIYEGSTKVHYIGSEVYYIKTDSVPVDRVYLGRKSWIAKITDGIILTPAWFKRMEPNDKRLEELVI
jgi:hypothetical protein